MRIISQTPTSRVAPPKSHPSRGYCTRITLTSKGTQARAPTSTSSATFPRQPQTTFAHHGEETYVLFAPTSTLPSASAPFRLSPNHLDIQVPLNHCSIVLTSAFLDSQVPHHQRAPSFHGYDGIFLRLYPSANIAPDEHAQVRSDRYVLFASRILFHSLADWPPSLRTFQGVQDEKSYAKY
jgi:hypothetical protein